eukprot:scaffold1290_cov367-Prasinococcus_capsulatus_cf.AAC.9
MSDAATPRRAEQRGPALAGRTAPTTVCGCRRRGRSPRGLLHTGTIRIISDAASSLSRSPCHPTCCAEKRNREPRRPPQVPGSVNHCHLGG